MTQLEDAVKGRITEAMNQVADYEKLSPEVIRQRVADGSVVIPKNLHHAFSARGWDRA